MPTFTPSRAAQFGLGVAVSAVAIVLLAWHVEAGDVVAHLRGVEPRWLAALLLAKAGVLALKGLRWRGILAACLGRRPRGAMGAVAAGYLANLLLPLRMGEIVRIAAFRRADAAAPLGLSAASVGAERLLDGLVLGVLVSAVLPFAPAPAWVRRGTLILLAALLLLLAFAVVRPLHEAAARRLPEAGPLGLLRRVVRACSAGTSVLRRPRDLARAAALTACVWLGEALHLTLAFTALGLDVPYAGALVVTLLYAWGMLLPSGPVQLGTHQALAVLFLAPFGVTAAEAVGASLLIQAVALVVLGAAGGAGLTRVVFAPAREAEAPRGL